MTPEQYAAQQALISAAVARYIQQFGAMFAAQPLPVKQWIALLKLIFPLMQQWRSDSSALARQFYDDQRLLNYPDLPRNDRPLEGTTFETFVQNMEPARTQMSRPDAGNDAVAMLTLRAVREVENAGRQQIIHAVTNDTPQILRGWARVATGRETCAWCLMLISRGPTYFAAETSGLDLDEDAALEKFTNADDLSTYFEDISGEMEQWHAGCDCKVVPVFKQQNWFGQEAADRALELWNQASKIATKARELNPDRRHAAGKRKGRHFTHNEETINILRAMLGSGEIHASEYAALAA